MKKFYKEGCRSRCKEVSYRDFFKKLFLLISGFHLWNGAHICLPKLQSIIEVVVLG